MLLMLTGLMQAQGTAGVSLSAQADTTHVTMRFSGGRIAADFDYVDWFRLVGYVDSLPPFSFVFECDTNVTRFLGVSSETGLMLDGAQISATPVPDGYRIELHEGRRIPNTYPVLFYLNFRSRDVAAFSCANRHAASAARFGHGATAA